MDTKASTHTLKLNLLETNGEGGWELIEISIVK